MNGMDLTQRLQFLLDDRSRRTKEITSLMKEIAVATDRPIPESAENPLDYADSVVVKTLNPAIPFINAGGQLVMSEDHTAHRHEYTIRLIVDFAKQ